MRQQSSEPQEESMCLHMSSELKKSAAASSPESPLKTPSTAGQAQQARRASELCLPEARHWGAGDVLSTAPFMPLPGLCLCRNWRLGVSSYKPSNFTCFGHVCSCHTVWEAKTKYWARTLGEPVPGRLATNVFPHPATYSGASDKREAEV